MIPFHNRVLRFASLFALSSGLLSSSLLRAQTNQPARDLFAHSTDIGKAQAGETHLVPESQSYRVLGGGADVWGNADDLRLVWTRFSGDGSLTADVQVAQPGRSANAKGMLMFRQSLDPGSPYADVAIHADGHITLQWRATVGGPTMDTVLSQHGTTRLRIARTGNRFTASIGPGDVDDAPSITIPLENTVYVGLGVCSHDTAALQVVTFSDVKLESGTKGNTFPRPASR